MILWEENFMINKKGLWFLTLSSLVLVLGVYYVTMPDEIFESKEISVNNKKGSTDDEADKSKAKEVNKENTSYIETLKVELDSERSAELEELQSVINDSSKSTAEKNKAYEEMKNINDIKAKEEEIEKKIKSEYSLSSYVKQSDDKVEVVIDSKKHDISIANKIMRCVEEEYDDHMQVSVKFS